MKSNPMRHGHIVAAVALASLATATHAAQITWNNSTGGDYSTAANWNGALIPANTVLFNRGSAGYTVAITGNINQAGLTIGNDHLTFSLNGALYGASPSVPFQLGTGSAANSAILLLQSNSTNPVAEPSFFNTNNAILGASSGAAGLVTVDNARGAVFWNNDGNLAIGGANGNGVGSFLGINANTSVATDSTLTLFSGSALNLNGGTLSMGTFDRRAGSTLVWTTGIMQITASAVTVNAGGIFANGSNLNAQQELDAQQGLTINAAGALNLNGGTLSASTFVNNGSFTFNTGTLGITSSDVTIDAGGIFNTNNLLSTGKTLSVTGNTTITAGNALQLSGGTLNTGTLAIQPGASLAFTAGTLQLTNSDLTIGPGGLLGSALTLNAGRAVIVTLPLSQPPNGLTTIAAGGNLLISGGAFSTAELAIAGGTFGFTSGTFSLTNSNVTINAAGLLGTSSTFGAGRNLNVSGGIILATGGNLAISGGSVFTGTFVNSGGTLSFTSGTLGITGDDLHIAPGTPLGAAFSVNNNMTLEVDNSGTLFIDNASTLTLNGGTINAAQLTLTGSGHLVFNTGTLNLTASTFLVDPAGPLGGALTLNPGQTILAPLATTISPGSHLTLSGGRLSTGSLTTTASALTFNTGELDLTASGLSIGTAGPLGTSVTLLPSQIVNTSAATTIDPGASLSLAGGSLITSGISNNGTFTFSTGTLHITHDPVTIASSGLFGTTPTLSTGKTLIVDAPLTVQGGQTLSITGGSLQARILYVGQASNGAIVHSAGSVNITTSLIVGSVSSASYALSGTGSLTAATLQLSSLNGTFTQTGGTANVTDLNIGASNTFTLSTGTFTAAHSFNDGTINHSSGTLNVGLVDGAGSMNISGTGHATADSIRQTTISLSNNATISLNPNIGPDSTSTLQGLSITDNAKLDLNNTSLAYYSTPSAKAADYSELRDFVNIGRAGGTWSGTAITSSAAQAAYSAHLNQEFTGLAVVRNDQMPVPFNTFAGVPVDLDTILVKYTYVGDADLDGKITLDDYLAIDRGFALHLTGWQNGDFNNDGFINVTDYAAIDRVFAGQGSPLAADLIAEHAAEFGAPYLSLMAIPEPATLTILACAGTCLLRRRTQKR